MDENSKEIVGGGSDPVKVLEVVTELEKANELLVDFYNQWLKALGMAKKVNWEYFEHRAKCFSNEVCIDMHNIQGKMAIVRAQLNKGLVK